MLTMGFDGMRSRGTATVIFSKLVEIAITLNAENFIEELPKTKFNSKANPLNEYEGTTFERLALFAGFEIESKTTNQEGISTYILYLKEFWLPQTPKFLESLVSFGGGLNSGFTDFSDSFCWFYYSDVDSKIMKTSSYSY